MTVSIAKTRLYFVSQVPTTISKTRVYMIVQPIFHVTKVVQHIATSPVPSSLVRKAVSYIIIGPQSSGPTGRARRVVNIVM